MNGERNSYSVVDLDTLDIIRTVKLSGEPHDALITPDGKFLYVTPPAQKPRVGLLASLAKARRQREAGHTARPHRLHARRRARLRDEPRFERSVRDGREITPQHQGQSAWETGAHGVLVVPPAPTN